ncbi:hypothetical protein INR49_027715, partial [Caranx melampygus]
MLEGPLVSSAGLGRTILDLLAVVRAAPPVLVQMVVMDEGLQTVGSSCGFFLFCEMKHCGIFPGANHDITCRRE